MGVVVSFGEEVDTGFMWRFESCFNREFQGFVYLQCGLEEVVVKVLGDFFMIL